MEPFEVGEDAIFDMRPDFVTQAVCQAFNGDWSVSGACELQPGVCAENCLENAVFCLAGCRLCHGKFGKLWVPEETSFLTGREFVSET